MGADFADPALEERCGTGNGPDLGFGRKIGVGNRLDAYSIFFPVNGVLLNVINRLMFAIDQWNKS